MKEPQIHTHDAQVISLLRGAPTLALSALTHEHIKAGLLERAARTRVLQPKRYARKRLWAAAVLLLGGAGFAAGNELVVAPRAERLVSSRADVHERGAHGVQLCSLAADRRGDAVSAMGQPRLRENKNVLASLPVDQPRREPPTQLAVAELTARASVDAPDDVERAFREGWGALRRGQPQQAALWLSAVPEQHALAEDARYWQGIALVRANRLEEAAQLLARFIDSYPNAVRGDEVALLLGRVFLQQNKQKQAVAQFARGLLADDPNTRARAAEAMATIRAQPH